MKLPRNLDGEELIRHLCRRWGYHRIHQVGSHVVLETSEPSCHRVVVPDHHPLRVGTLAAVLRAVAAHKGESRDALIEGL
ncbi:MAG: type II toxin-antitoxin system HicA family toxin [Acidobacteria bacterium]|jgi:predicted RNA binding protein YcfA (HicA-like mRNA interferase family)|nr:type II toxin-antitoxin system HicA family toxin [Acidobacteriota bacterium]